MAVIPIPTFYSVRAGAPCKGLFYLTNPLFHGVCYFVCLVNEFGAILSHSFICVGALECRTPRLKFAGQAHLGASTFGEGILYP